MGGSLNHRIGAPFVNPVVGPLSTSLEGLKMFMKTVLEHQPWIQDPTLIPLPWREPSLTNSLGGGKKLKVGILWSDEVVRPHPPIHRALQEMAKELRNIKNVEVVDWKPYKHDLAWELIVSLLLHYLLELV